MIKLPTTDPDFVLTIHDAAKYLGVSTKTLRRWEAKGILTSQRTPGGHRRYSEKKLDRIKEAIAVKKTETTTDYSQFSIPRVINIPPQRQIAVIDRSKSIILANTESAPVLYTPLHLDQKKVLAGATAFVVIFFLIFGVIKNNGKFRIVDKLAVLRNLPVISQFLSQDINPQEISTGINHIGSVLQAATGIPSFSINVQSTFAENSTFEKDVEIKGTLTLDNALVIPSLETTAAITAGTNITAGGDLAVNGGDITTTQTTLNLINTTATTLNIGGAATTLKLGASSGTTTVNNDFKVSGSTTLGTTITGTLTASSITDSGTLSISGNLSKINGVSYTWPSSQGAASTVLANDGAGTLSWSTASVDVSSAIGVLPIEHGGTNNSTAYTIGSVIFSDGTKLTQDNSNFFWDDTNNRLGIGTSSPSYALHVAGNIAVASTYSILPATNLGSDLGSSSLRFNNLYVATINSNATLDLTGQAVFTYDPTDTTFTQASVLINPTSPAANEMLLGLGYGGYEKAGIDREGDLVIGYNGLVTAPTSDNPLRIYNHNSTLLATIDTSGNFGVGNAAPTKPLDVLGSVAFRTKFDYRQTITITNAGGTLTNYDILVELDTATLIAAGKMQSDCDDIRFTDADQQTPLTYWLEQGCNTATTQFWVRVPSIPNGSKYVYMVYGNSTSSSGSTSWAGNFILMSNAACPAGWTSLSGGGGALNAKFPMGFNSYGGTGGSDTHTHTVSGNSPTGAASTCFYAVGQSNTSHPSHTHSYSLPSTSASSLPVYADIVFCSRAAPIDLLATNFIGLHTTTPSGWSSVAALNGKFFRGAASYNAAAGGADSHTHAVSGNVASTSLNNPVYASIGAFADSNHYHTVSSQAVNSTSIVPPYIEYIPATPDSASTKLPQGIITYFDVAPPLGWTRLSSLDSKFIRGNSSSSGSSGGSSTHSHSYSIATNGPSATVNRDYGGASSCGTSTHTHTLSGDSSSENNLPAYINTLIYQRNTPAVTLAYGSEQTGSYTPIQVYYDDTTSNLGVGTLTPLWKLQVSDNQSATASALVENTASLANNPTGLIIRLGNDSTNPDNGDRFINFMQGDSTIVGKVQGNGSGGVLYTTSGTDFAEYFEKANPAEQFSSGEIVCVAASGKITKCDSTNTNIVGAISDKAGFAGGGDKENNPNYVLVGLLGQLDIKVSTEGGIIKSGDALAFSSHAGVAAKAGKEGYIIGKALEDWDETKDRLLTYINPGWYNLGISLSSTGEVANQPISTESATATASATPSAALSTSDLFSAEELKNYLDSLKNDITLLKETQLMASNSGNTATSSGLLTLSDLVVTNGINVGTLSFTPNSIDAIGTLKLQGDTIQIDTNGNLIIKTGKIIGNDSFRGSEILPAGSSTLKINRTWDSPPKSITITPSYNTSFWITGKGTDGFTINVSTPPPEDAIIDWITVW